jgi:NAD-dependent dihydropyrimidine dehydrogenase PreA subunit
MQRPLHIVSVEKCKGDGICVEVCPKDVLEIHDGKVRTVEIAALHCIRCGQCVAVCPNEALELDGLAPTDVERVTPWKLPFEDLLAFLRSRRSVRTFADRPVDRALIDRVLEAAAAAPPGFPPQSTEVLVIDRREDIEQLTRALVDSYDKLLSMYSSPIGRMMIRLKRGAETLNALKTHVIQIVRWDNERYRSRGVDR